MAPSIVVTFALALLLSGAGCGYCGRPNDQTVAALWLARNCVLVERNDLNLETEIRKRGRTIEPLFLDAFSHGPKQADVDAVLASAKSTYDRRQQRLSGGTTDGLSTPEVAALRSAPLASEQQRAKDDFDHGYRAAALIALGIIDRPQGRALLQQLASLDAASPFQYVASLAIKKKSR